MNDRESEDIETFGYYGENFSELRVFIKKAIHIKPIVSLMRNLALSSYEHFDGGVLPRLNYFIIDRGVLYSKSR